jgi:hypothetical protein
VGRHLVSALEQSLCLLVRQEPEGELLVLLVVLSGL